MANLEKTTSAFPFGVELGLLVKAPIGIAGLFYVIGVFVHTTYYGRFGINSLNLVDLSYFLAGFWAFFYLVIPASAVLLVTSCLLYPLLDFLISVKNRKLKLNWKEIWQYSRKPFTLVVVSTGVVIAFGLFYVFDVFASDNIVYVRSWVLPGRQGEFPAVISDSESPKNLFWVSIYNSLFFVLSIAIVSLLVCLILRYIKNYWIRLIAVLVITSMSFPALLGIVDTFSRNTFSLIPQKIGGGRPIKVVAVVDAGEETNNLLSGKLISAEGLNVNDPWRATSLPQGSNDLEETQPEIDENQSDFTILTILGNLLLESNDGFYFQVGQNEVVFIPRDELKTINYDIGPGLTIIEPVH